MPGAQCVLAVLYVWALDDVRRLASRIAYDDSTVPAALRCRRPMSRRSSRYAERLFHTVGIAYNDVALVGNDPDRDSVEKQEIFPQSSALPDLIATGFALFIEFFFQFSSDGVKVDRAVNDVQPRALQERRVSVIAAVDDRLGERVGVGEVNFVSRELGLHPLESRPLVIGNVLRQVYVDVVDLQLVGDVRDNFFRVAAFTPQELPQAVVSVIASVSVSSVRLLISLPLRVGMLIGVLVTVLLLS